MPIARQTAPAVESKEKVSVRLPATLCDEMRDAVAQLGLTLDQLVMDGIRLHLELLKREHTGGEPFEQRPVRTTRALRPGRPIGR